MLISRRAFVGGLAALPLTLDESAAAVRYDVVIYGATPSGVMAAVAARREAKSVALVSAGPMGGMMANGLGATDVGNIAVIGGLADAFFRQNGRAYRRPIEYAVEPGRAEALFRAFLADSGIPVVDKGTVRRVAKDSRRITALVLDTGLIIRGKAFVDASYEGDLLAAAGCSYRVGREGRAEFGEPLAGFNVVPHENTSKTRDSKGRPFDLLLPWPDTERYAADGRIQAYTFRLCLTTDPANRVPFAKPPGYDADRFLFEINRLNERSAIRPTGLPGGKYDLNGNYYGRSWRWPEATWAERRLIWSNHYTYLAGLLYAYANDPRVPSTMRAQVSQFGLPKDEFTDNGNWPRQLYVREARRLRGVTVLQQKDCVTETGKDHPIGLGSYPFDSHATGVFRIAEKRVNFEGEMGTGNSVRTGIYQIPYECLLPSNLDNLLVSVCVSASHVAFSSLRMEPQYMIMGEAAGLAAGLVARTGQTSLSLASGITSALLAAGAKVWTKRSRDAAETVSEADGFPAPAPRSDGEEDAMP